MSKTTLLIGASAIVIALAACEGENKQKKPQSGRVGYQGPQQTNFQPEASPSPSPATDETAVVTATPTPTPAAIAPSTSGGNLPYGTPIPGKPGFVSSPHSPYSGYVDVRGYPPGTEVKDPYTGKIFLVP